MRYKLRTKFGKGEEAERFYSSLTEALFEGGVFMDTWTEPDERVGSLRADGHVNLWNNHQMMGYVILEEKVHDQYVRRTG